MKKWAGVVWLFMIAGLAVDGHWVYALVLLWLGYCYEQKEFERALRQYLRERGVVE